MKNGSGKCKEKRVSECVRDKAATTAAEVTGEIVHGHAQLNGATTLHAARVATYACVWVGMHPTCCTYVILIEYCIKTCNRALAVRPALPQGG